MKRNVLLDWRSCFGLFLLTLTLALWAQPVSGQNSLSSAVSANSAANLLSNGGFETASPAFWESTGDGAEWSTDQFRTPSYSLKLSGATAASWAQNEAVRAWVPSFPPDGTPEFTIGGWVYTDGVNTAPVGDDAKFQLVFEFFDVPGGTNVLGAPVVLDLPQDAASSGGWVELSSATLGAITFPVQGAATSARITFRKGANATGTAYLEDIFVRASAGWPGDWFNANMDAGDNWYYWWDGMASGGDFPTAQPHFQSVTDEDAHSGSYSLRIERNGAATGETPAISQRVPVTGGEPVLFSFWVKHDGNTNPTEIGMGDNNLGMTALWYNNPDGGAAGWGEIGGVDVRLNGQINDVPAEQLFPLLLQETSSGWSQYAAVAYANDDAVAVEMRLRYWHAFDGVTYWDDVFIAPVSSLSDLSILSNGGFETASPAFWESTGDGAEWSTDQFRTPSYSLKLSGATAASWAQNEAVRAWVPSFPPDGTPEFTIGGWVYTDGVNTAPVGDDAKFQLVFEFFDVPGGTNVLGAPVVLDLPQDAASSGGWVELSSATLGAITFPVQGAATSARITFRKGANATGTAYLEDIFVRASAGWPGDWFNANMDAGDNWYYWWDGMASGGDFPTAQPHFQSVTDEDAHSGSYSLRIERNGAATGETPAISQRVPVTGGEPVLFSFWVKHDGNTNPTEIGMGDNNLGMTALWYNNPDGGAAGWGEIGGVDVRLNGQINDVPAEQLFPLLLQETSSGWSQYAAVAYANDDAVAVEMRLRYWHAFDGVTYWDDVSIVPLGGSSLVTAIEDAMETRELPETFQLHQNYPNPFNPNTSISFDLVSNSRVTLEVYNILGQRVRTLIANADMSTGSHTISFDASTLTSGVYLYALKANGRTAARQMVLLK